jgi:hypothetical protein
MLLSLDSTVGNVSVANISRRMIDLNGPQGNAFYLLGLVSEAASRLKLSKYDITQRMMSGDYLNLVATFEYYFGSIYYLVLTEDMSVSDLENAVNQIRKEVENVQN